MLIMSLMLTVENSATSMLVTNVGDSLCWRQVRDDELPPS